MTMPLIVPAPADITRPAGGAPAAGPAGETVTTPDEHSFAALFAAMLAPAATPVAAEVVGTGPATAGDIEAPGGATTGDPTPPIPTATVGTPTDRPAGLTAPAAEAPLAGAATTVEATVAATADRSTAAPPADRPTDIAPTGVEATTPSDNTATTAVATEATPTGVPDSTDAAAADTSDVTAIETTETASADPATAQPGTGGGDTTNGETAGDDAGNPAAPRAIEVADAPAPGLVASAVGANRIDPAPVQPTTTVAAPTPTAATATAEQVVSVIAPLRDTADGAHRISLSLRPAELGTLELDVRIVDGVVHLGLRADDARTAELLRQSLAELRSTLDGAGLATGSLTVADHHVGQGRPDAERGGEHLAHPATSRDPRGSDAVDASPTTRPTRNDVGLDVLL